MPTRIRQVSIGEADETDLDLPQYLRGKDKRFVAWDGEGITYKGDKTQSYVLFGASTGDSLIAEKGLSTRQCFDLLLSVESRFPDAIHVGFALQYDFNMMFRDLSNRQLWTIYKRHSCHWEGYRIEYRPGKWLSVRKHGTTIRLFDVFGFFQSSFVVACEKYLGAEHPDLVRIREGKASRKDFAYSDLHPYITPYWEGELSLLVRLMDSLRDDLKVADIQIRSWHGPGAVANAVFRINNISIAKGESPKEVNRASQYAFAGGRFELFKAGHYAGQVWEYDINSAYPAAMAGLPNLSTGRWESVTSFERGTFGVWWCEYASIRKQGEDAIDKWNAIQPLFCRADNGNVSYPPYTRGWYWTPEAELIPEHMVKHGWVYRDDGSKPFAFINDMYERRQEWKSQGKSAEKALKLALNSLYGKTAQRVGWTPENPTIPQWHQLEWAGYVTSLTRAKLYRASLIAPGSIVAIETDAIFSTVALPLPISKALGDFGVETFDSITYLQNGLYYATRGLETVERYRGFDRGSLPYRKVLDYLAIVDRAKQRGKARVPSLTGVTTRFIGMGLGLRTSATWRSWTTDRKSVHIGGGGKRVHIERWCTACRQGLPWRHNLHSVSQTTGAMFGRPYSQPHALPWLYDQERRLREEDELAKW